MCSTEGESVGPLRHLNVNKSANRGAVEGWLDEVEVSMVDTLQEPLQEAQRISRRTAAPNGGFRCGRWLRAAANGCRGEQQRRTAAANGSCMRQLRTAAANVGCERQL